jgi:hypothetical protein
MRLGAQGVRGGDVERQLVLGDRRDAQLAGDGLGDQSHDVRVELAVLDVEHRHLELLGERGDEVLLADEPRMQQDVAELGAGAALLAQRRLDLLVGDRAVGHEQVADARRVRRRRAELLEVRRPQRAEDPRDRELDVVGRGQHHLHLRRRERRDELGRELVEGVAEGDRDDPVAIGDRQHVEVPAELLGQQPRRERVDLRIARVGDRLLVEHDEGQARVAGQAAVEGGVVEPVAVVRHSAALRSS